MESYKYNYKTKIGKRFEKLSRKIDQTLSKLETRITDKETFDNYIKVVKLSERYEATLEELNNKLIKKNKRRS